MTVPRRLPSRALPIVTALNGRRRPGGAERQQPDPGDEALVRAEPRVGDRVEGVATEVGNRAVERRRAGQQDVDVERGRLEIGPAGGGELLHRRLDLRQDRCRQLARREEAPGALGRQALLEAGAGEAGGEEPLGDSPLLQVVELDGEGVVHLAAAGRRRDPETLAEKGADGMLHEALQPIELERGELEGGERAGEPRAGRRPGGEPTPWRRRG